MRIYIAVGSFDYEGSDNLYVSTSEEGMAKWLEANRSDWIKYDSIRVDVYEDGSSTPVITY